MQVFAVDEDDGGIGGFDLGDSGRFAAQENLRDGVGRTGASGRSVLSGIRKV